MQPVPYEILEAMVQCFGKCFHYKDGVTSFFLSSGVPRALNDQHRNEAKYVWARRVLTELGQTEEGCLVQRKILTELCRLRDLPDKDVPDRDAGLKALRTLKTMAVEKSLLAEQDKKTAQDRLWSNQEAVKVAQERANKLETLRKAFNDAILLEDRQRAGYALQDLLKDLFALFEIEYRKPYKVGTIEDFDGHFNFRGFDYLVEARWRKDMPTVQEIGGFKSKVDRDFQSNRGVFVSVQGYRQEVIEEFNRTGTNIILIDGRHLVEILEGRIDLRDALRVMIDKAAQEGLAYTPCPLR
jgi:hypothetical protein